MTAFTESDRFSYSSLNRDTWVLELGAHCGKSARILAEKYGCRIVCYEPIVEFHDKIIEMLAANQHLANLIVPICAGVGATERKEKFRIHGELTGIVSDGPEQEVHIIPIYEVLMAWTGILGRPPELLCVNIENMEYELFEAILDRGLESQFAHIQVQPHSGVPLAAARWAGIRNRLMMNFRIDHEDPSLDTGWMLASRK